MGQRRLILPPVENNNNVDPLFKIKTYDHVKKYFLVICRFGEGDYFGVGEDFAKMSIISVNKVGIFVVVCGNCHLLLISHAAGALTPPQSSSDA